MAEDIYSKYSIATRRQQAKIYEANVAKWKLDPSIGITLKGELPKFVRRYIRAKYDERCVRCGWKEVHTVTGNVPVQIEHIDGNASNNCENNLTLLCPNCHSLTPTFGNLNRGNGRTIRKRNGAEGENRTPAL